jgi:hypothetical protein
MIWALMFLLGMPLWFCVLGILVQILNNGSCEPVTATSRYV